MPHPCVVCGRSRMNPNNREEEYTFFGFPVNDEPRCMKWLEFCCREDLYKLTKKQLLQRMVCSKHFTQKDFINDYLDRLNCSAVPSIYDPKQSLYNICCVLCKRTRNDPPGPDYDGATFHHFPGEEFRCLKWLDFVGVNSYYRLTRKEILFCYICSKHFDSSQFIANFKNRLVDDAVPNIRYPDECPQLEFGFNEAKFVPREPPKKHDPLPPEVLESQACAACGRSRSDARNKIEKYKFHPFPAYEIGRCLRWCQFLGREDLLKMSPNQIRKLVLCSKHFEAGQSFHKVGPCDAVPTIWNPDSVVESLDVSETDENLKRKQARPLVSSKKPKVDNKPAPLAKKRGKSRRSTSINIPRPDTQNVDNRISKLPLPPSSWKLVNSQPFQPITIANNVLTNANSEIKKVILPFTGDIANLGAPIPVHSLSSIPPGLLIKINLPNQDKKFINISKKPRPKKEKLKVEPLRETTLPVVTEELIDTEDIVTEYVDFEEQEVFLSGEVDIQEEVKFQENDVQEVYVKDEHFNIESQMCTRRKRTTSRTRRTIFPITCELRRFLRKLKPHMNKLPKKAKAQVKLCIVNKVIDLL